MSEYVIREAGSALRRLCVDLQDVDAREKMSYCSMLMGINLGNAGTALPHRMQYPLGVHTGSSHGAGLAALYPAWMEYEMHYAEQKMRRVYELLACVDIRDFLEKMKLNRTLSYLGIEEVEIMELVSEVAGNIKNDPAAEEPDVIEKIYRKSL